MRTALMWLCIALSACASREPIQLRESSELVSELVQKLSKPRATMHALAVDVDVLLTRSDAVDAIAAEYAALPARAQERWVLLRLATVAAVRGRHKAVDFLLSEALAPNPNPVGGNGMRASDGEPLEFLNKLEASTGLVAALIADPAGTSSAIQQLLQQSDPWLAKSAAMEMAHARVMDAQYSGILASRGMVSRFREMTPEENRHYTTIATTAVNSGPLPPAR